MTTTKSFSNDAKFGPAYKSAFKAQFPFAIVSGILFFILFIVVFFASTVERHDPVNARYFFQEYFKQGIYADMSQSVFAYIILAVIALASTLAGMSYLHSKKTVDVYHSLPVTRPQLLGANLLATLTAVLGPFLAMYLLTMVIQFVSCARYDCFGTEYFRFILFDIMAAIIYTIVIAAFTAFVAVNVGTVFDTFAVTMAIGFTPLTVYLTGGVVWQSLVYGALFEPGEKWLYLSPFTFIFKVYMAMDRRVYSDAISIVDRDYAGAAWILLYGVVLAAVILILAAVCYKRRKSEIAEQTQPRGVLQVIVKLVATFLGGVLFFAIFNGWNSATKLVSVLLGSAGIGLIAEIILSRGVKWVGKNFKWIIGAGAVYCLLLVGVQADVFGYAYRVPELGSIASVRINYNGRFGETDSYPENSGGGLGPLLTDAESIAIVRETHNIAVNNRPPKSFDDANYEYDTIRIEYKLKNGATMSRTYSPVYEPAYAKLAELENKDGFIRANSALFWAEQNPSRAKVETVELYAFIGGTSGRHANVLDDPELLLDAVRADMLDQSLEDITNPPTPALGFIKVNFRHTGEAEYRNGYFYGAPYATVIVTSEYKRTIEVLNKLKLAGDFTSESLRIDIDNVINVVEIGLLPTWEWYYDANRVRTFVPRQGDNDMMARLEASYEYSEKDGYPYSVFYTSSDVRVIKAMAQVSKDTLLIPGRQDWHKNYAIIYFKMTDGSYMIKTVRLSDLPPNIREIAIENYQEVYGEASVTDTTETKPAAIAETTVTAQAVA